MNERAKRSLAGLALLLAVFAAPPKAAAAKRALMSVDVGVANFRAGPSSKHEILFTATRYFPVEIMGSNGDWVRVRDFEKEQAWIAKRLLSKRATLIVEVKKGNVRAEASTQGDVVDEVEYGEVFRIVERKGRWLRIATPQNVIGWVRNDLTWGERSKAS